MCTYCRLWHWMFLCKPIWLWSYFSDAHSWSTSNKWQKETNLSFLFQMAWLLGIHPHIAVLLLFVRPSDPNWCHCTCSVCLIPNRPFSKLMGGIKTAFDELRLLYLSFIWLPGERLADHGNRLHYFAVCHCQMRYVLAGKTKRPN